MVFNKAYVAAVPFDNSYKTVYDFINLQQSSGSMVSGSLLEYLRNRPDDFSPYNAFSKIYDGNKVSFNMVNEKATIILPQGGNINYMILTFGEGTANVDIYYFFVTEIETLETKITTSQQTEYQSSPAKYTLELDVWSTYYDRIRRYNGIEHITKQTYDQWKYDNDISKVVSKNYYTEEKKCQTVTSQSFGVDCNVLWIKCTINNSDTVYYKKYDDTYAHIQYGVGLRRENLPNIYIPLLADIGGTYCYIDSLYDYLDYGGNATRRVLPSLRSDFIVSAEFTWNPPFIHEVEKVQGNIVVTVATPYVRCGYVFTKVDASTYDPIVYSTMGTGQTPRKQPVMCVVESSTTQSVFTASVEKAIPSTDKSVSSYGTKNSMRNSVGVYMDDARIQYYPYKYYSILANGTFTPIKEGINSVIASSYGGNTSYRHTAFSDSFEKKSYYNFTSSNGEYEGSVSSLDVYKQSKGIINQTKVLEKWLGVLSDTISLQIPTRSLTNVLTTNMDIAAEEAQSANLPDIVNNVTGVAVDDIVYQNRVILSITNTVDTNDYKRIKNLIKEFGINYNNDDTINKAYHIIFDYKQIDNPRMEIKYLPDFARKKLKEMFRNGVRIWHIDTNLATASGNDTYKDVLSNMDLDASNPTITQYYYGGT